MEVSLVRDILQGSVSLDSIVNVRGWVRTKRDSKAGVSFVHLHDGTCFHPIQLVIPNTIENYQDEVLKLTTGCPIQATGKVVASQGKGQKFEIQVESVTVISYVENPESYPLAAKRHTLEHLREVAHLRPRTNTIGAVTRIRHIVSQAIHEFFSANNFYWLHTPIITASDTEGAGELFTVSTLDLANLPIGSDKKVDFSQDFFGKQAYLTVSGQLNAEAYALAMSNVYTFGPTFRAENSNTSRHLAEFWMVEPEIAFADLQDDITLAERLLKHIFAKVLKTAADDMQFFNDRYESTCISRLEKVISSNFEQIDYREAIKLLQQAKKKFEFKPEFGLDLQTEHERYLADEIVGGPAVIINYPKDIKAFYMRSNDDNETVAAMDVIAPGIGEIIGGSQREERLDVLDNRLRELNLEPEDYQWYRDLRRYGTVPHAGFGLGLDRLINYITGLTNIRDVVPFPRTPKHVEF